MAISKSQLRRKSSSLARMATSATVRIAESTADASLRTTWSLRRTTCKLTIPKVYSSFMKTVILVAAWHRGGVSARIVEGMKEICRIYDHVVAEIRSPICSTPTDSDEQYVLPLGIFPRIPQPEFELFAAHRHDWEARLDGTKLYKFMTASGEL